MSTARRFSSRSARMLLACGAFLIGLLVCEIAVRVLDLAPKVKSLAVAGNESVYERSTNPVLGFELKADYRNPDADFSGSYPFTNAHGQRDVERTLEKPAGTRRVLLLGDSVVEGHDIRDFDQTIGRRLERLYPAGTIEVLNFGVSGYCTRAEVELLEVKGLRFDPDVVLLVFTANDFDNFNREAFRLESRVHRPAPVERLFLTSSLFRLLSLRWNWFQFGAEFDPVGWNAKAIAENNVTAGLRRLAELSRRHGFRPVIAIWPVFESDGIHDVHAMPGDSGDLVVERLAAMYGLEAVRLSDYFRSDAAARVPPVDPRRTYTVGDKLHPSPEGCRVAATALHTVLTEMEHRDSPAPEAGVADELAMEAARAIGSAEPDYSRVHSNAGLALRREGRLAEALEQFRQAVALDPSFVEGRSNLAGALWATGELEEAIEHYLLAVELSPEQADLQYNLGLAIEAAGRPSEALERFRIALRIDPESARTHRAIARLLASGGDPEQAVEHYRRALELGPASADLSVELGNALTAQRRFDEAAAAFEQALRLEPRHVRALSNLAMLHAATGRMDEAIRELRRAVAIDPTYALAHRNLARALNATGETEEARRHLREAERLQRE